MRRWLSKLTLMNNSYSIPIGPFTISWGKSCHSHQCLRLYLFINDCTITWPQKKKRRVSLLVGSLRIENIHKTREGQLVGPSECTKNLRMLPLKRGRFWLRTSIRWIMNQRIKNKSWFPILIERIKRVIKY